MGNRVQRNVSIDGALSREVTNAVEWLKDNVDASYTASEMFEGGIGRELKRLRDKFRDQLPGGEFPEAQVKYIRPGRPPTGKI